MKRIISTVLCLFALLSALTGFSACSKEETRDTVGRVLLTEGKRSHIAREDGVLPAYNGLPIIDGDEINVNIDSAVYIALGDAVFVRLEADSRATVENDRDGDMSIRLDKGAIYCEAAGGREHPVSVLTEDVVFVAEDADFRVEKYVDTVHNSLNSHVQAIRGSVAVTAGSGDTTVTDGGKRSRVERILTEDSDEAFFAVRNQQLDRYTLPDRYIEMGENGIFEADGMVVPAKPSGDLSVRKIGFINSDGSVAQLDPEFDAFHPIYTVTTDKPFEFYIELNHRRTALEMECFGAKRVYKDGDRYTVRFDAENTDWQSYVVSVCIKAENGDIRRFTVTVSRAV